jgi:hypothetical protein
MSQTPQRRQYTFQQNRKATGPEDPSQEREEGISYVLSTANSNERQIQSGRFRGSLLIKFEVEPEIAPIC